MPFLQQNNASERSAFTVIVTQQVYAAEKDLIAQCISLAVSDILFSISNMSWNKFVFMNSTMYRLRVRVVSQLFIHKTFCVATGKVMWFWFCTNHWGKVFPSFVGWNSCLFRSVLIVYVLCAVPLSWCLNDAVNSTVVTERIIKTESVWSTVHGPQLQSLGFLLDSIAEDVICLVPKHIFCAPCWPCSSFSENIGHLQSL